VSLGRFELKQVYRRMPERYVFFKGARQQNFRCGNCNMKDCIISKFFFAAVFFTGWNEKKKFWSAIIWIIMGLEGWDG